MFPTFPESSLYTKQLFCLHPIRFLFKPPFTTQTSRIKNGFFVKCKNNQDSPIFQKSHHFFGIESKNGMTFFGIAFYLRVLPPESFNPSDFLTINRLTVQKSFTDASGNHHHLVHVPLHRMHPFGTQRSQQPAETVEVHPAHLFRKVLCQAGIKFARRTKLVLLAFFG